jgi:hypothetical protein
LSKYNVLFTKANFLKKKKLLQLCLFMFGCKLTLMWTGDRHYIRIQSGVKRFSGKKEAVKPWSCQGWSANTREEAGAV